MLRNALALLWLRARGVRIVARLGNAPAPGRFYRLLWRYVINPLRRCLRLQFRVHAPGAAGAWQVRPDKVQTIPNMPARRATQWNANGPRVPGRIIFVGQIIPEKGLDVLLEAVALLRGRGVEATLDVVGDMDGWESPAYQGHRASLRARAGRADLEGAVSFLGWREDVPTLMSRASVHCCPSRLGATGSVRERRPRGENVGRPLGGHDERRSSRTGDTRGRRLGLSGDRPRTRWQRVSNSS